MLNLYDHTFKLPKGNVVFVPSAHTTRFGDKLIEWVLRKWTPPAYYFHLKAGGHVAAARSHTPDCYFLRLDLSTFFDCVTRTKVDRALKLIGFKARDAFEYAQNSTVEKIKGSHKYSLPFGFPQSPLLSSLVLYYSALGQELNRISREGYTVSVYVDDIILSCSTSIIDLQLIKDRLFKSALRCGFEFSESKSEGPGLSLTAFNIWIGHRVMKLIDERILKFKDAMRSATPGSRKGILSYVSTVDKKQVSLL